MNSQSNVANLFAACVEYSLYHDNGLNEEDGLEDINFRTKFSNDREEELQSDSNACPGKAENSRLYFEGLQTKKERIEEHLKIFCCRLENTGPQSWGLR